VSVVTFIIIQDLLKEKWLWAAQAGSLHLDLWKRRSELVAGRVEAICGLKRWLQPPEAG